MFKNVMQIRLRVDVVYTVRCPLRSRTRKSTALEGAVSVICKSDANNTYGTLQRQNEELFVVTESISRSLLQK